MEKTAGKPEVTRSLGTGGVLCRRLRLRKDKVGLGALSWGVQQRLQWERGMAQGTKTEMGEEPGQGPLGEHNGNPGPYS